MVDTNVWLFYPNLIGYARIAFALLSFEAMLYAPVRAAVFYVISASLDAIDGHLARMYNQCKSWFLLILEVASLDAIDGHLARMYNQCSRYGAMLDQLTDRCGTLGLVMTLGALYPKYLFLFQLSAVIDIASHWLHMHATDLTGQTTHKRSSNPILHLYYTSRKFLFWMCAGNEAFYWLLYINHFWSGPGFFGVYLIPLLAFCVFPVAFIKTLISIVHLVTASQTVVSHDISLIGRK